MCYVVSIDDISYRAEPEVDSGDAWAAFPWVVPVDIVLYRLVEFAYCGRFC